MIILCYLDRSEFENRLLPRSEVSRPDCLGGRKIRFNRVDDYSEDRFTRGHHYFVNGDKSLRRRTKAIEPAIMNGS